MKNDVLKVGIAGYGSIGKIRHEFINQHPNLKVTAVCDRAFQNPGQMPDGTKVWGNYKQLLTETLDALFVCLPNYMAADVTIAGLEQGLHVFCEKPPGRDLEDLARVMACEQKCPGAKLMYGFNHRYHDSIREAMRIIQSGELGHVIDIRGIYGKAKIIRFDSDWRTQRSLAGGGILLDQGIHMVDLMRLFAGDFVQVHSFVSNAHWKHDVEDNAYALMRTADGVVAILHSSATHWRHRFDMHITLSKGAIILSGILSSTKSYAPETITVVYAGENDQGDPKEQMTRYNDDHCWRDEIFDFAEAILHNKEITHGSSAEAMKTMQLVYKIYCADPEWKARYGLKDICG